ncbi:type IV pilus modification PilV family protein [Robertmurraya sp. Marseille-Q9965]
MKMHLKSESGLTLIEVLITLVIMSIVSGVIYSVFATGLKLYQKIGIEAQLRDDADYVATMILNEMYNNPPNFITNYETSTSKGIELVRFKPKNVDGYLVEDSTEIEQDLLIYFESDHFYVERIQRVTEEGVERIISLEKTQISSESSKFTIIDDDGHQQSSSITYNCTKEGLAGKCEHGRITLDIVIADNNDRLSNLLRTKPLLLESSFGF